ncbi:MAG: cupin domain-containing protein [Nocardioidaceae bacterium]
MTSDQPAGPADRVLGHDLLDAALAHEPLPADDVVEGAPTTATHPLGGLTGADGVEVGVWEMGEGVARDTEVDEIFVVLSGAGHVELEDGTVLELAPGVACRLHAGERTTWTVTETLRKLYVAG